MEGIGQPQMNADGKSEFAVLILRVASREHIFEKSFALSKICVHLRLSAVTN
jgi:hypothetical protein